jgi:formylglycine-generating enzyme required for sulfatase activity
VLGSSLVKYQAFLSYAHADARWGKWLHSQLENFRIDDDLAGRETPLGPVPKTLRPIFRDREDFSGGHSLTDATISALDQSRALIVLCSLTAATRPAVNEEVRLFRSRHPDRPVIPVVLDGIYPKNYPPALLFEIAPDGSVTDRSVTILGPDLREEGDGKRLALAKVIAGLTGVATDDIFRRSERAERVAKWRRRRNYALVTALLAVIATAGLTYRQWMPTLDVTAYKLVNLRKDFSKSGEIFQDCTSCPEMVVVPAGTFLMGSPNTEINRRGDEGPQHKVVIRKPFAVSRFEITFDQWDVCFAAGGCDTKLAFSHWGRGRQPVVEVSWDDATQFALWISKRTGRPYRLLSEAEWEYAARGVTDSSLEHTMYSWGNTVGQENANCNNCVIPPRWHATAPVGSFKPNAFGLYDMLGNASEWVQDCYKGSYFDAPSDAKAAIEKEDCSRIYRGGSFNTIARDLRLARRSFTFQNSKDVDIGFRVARILDTPP